MNKKSFLFCVYTALTPFAAPLAHADINDDLSDVPSLSKPLDAKKAKASNKLASDNKPKPNAKNYDNVWLQTHIVGQSEPIPLEQALRALVPDVITIILKSNVDTSAMVTWKEGTASTALDDILFQAHVSYSMPKMGYIVIESIPAASYRPDIIWPDRQQVDAKASLAKNEIIVTPEQIALEAKSAVKPSPAAVKPLTPIVTTKPSSQQPIINTTIAPMRPLPIVESTPTPTVLPSNVQPVRSAPAPTATPTTVTAPVQVPVLAPVPVTPPSAQTNSVMPTPVVSPVQTSSTAALTQVTVEPRHVMPVTTTTTPANIESHQAITETTAMWWTIAKGTVLSTGLSAWGEKLNVKIVWELPKFAAGDDIKFYGTFDYALLEFLKGVNRDDSGPKQAKVKKIKAIDYSKDGQRTIRIVEKS